MSKARQLYGKPWSEKEYIVALHFYFLHREEPREEWCDYVKEVSRLLGRTPTSIVMRMENFGSLDPEMNSVRRGLPNCGPICERIFAQWSSKRSQLEACAEVLIRDIDARHTATLFDPDPIVLPRAFGKYELLDCIGEGGTGSVYSCVDVESKETYAIKLIRPDTRFDRETLHRFAREMRILASITHPHVIRLREANLTTEDECPAFVMDLADLSLTQHMQRSSQHCQARPSLAASESLAIICSISSAVNALHENGAIHRDINPNNILRMPNGNWVLSDFGLAKFMPSAAAGTSFVTSTHAGWGTAYYAAPEQYRDFKTTDFRTDIYALGMLMWELLSGSWPPPDPRDLQVDGPVGTIIAKCIEREPNSRFSSVSAVLDELNRSISPRSAPQQ